MAVRSCQLMEFTVTFNYKLMLRPPSTAIICPVTYGAPVTRNSTARAISSGSPTRFSAVRSTMFLRVFGLFQMAASGHMIGPGDTPFTRTAGASSRASERVSAANPIVRLTACRAGATVA